MGPSGLHRGLVGGSVWVRAGGGKEIPFFFRVGGGGRSRTVRTDDVPARLPAVDGAHDGAAQHGQPEAEDGGVLGGDVGDLDNVLARTEDDVTARQRGDVDEGEDGGGGQDDVGGGGGAGGDGGVGGGWRGRGYHAHGAGGFVDHGGGR